MSEWISVKDRLPETKMDNVLFTLYTPAWHDLTDDFPEDERDFPEEYVTVCGLFEVFKNGDRYWNWLTSDGYHRCIRNEYDEAHLCNGCKTGEITYITHWMPLPEPPESED
jgi:hypothetical protein